MKKAPTTLLNISGRLASPVSELRRVLGVNVLERGLEVCK